MENEEHCQVAHQKLKMLESNRYKPMILKYWFDFIEMTFDLKPDVAHTQEISENVLSPQGGLLIFLHHFIHTKNGRVDKKLAMIAWWSLIVIITYDHQGVALARIQNFKIMKWNSKETMHHPNEFIQYIRRDHLRAVAVLFINIGQTIIRKVE